eukprot:NODE_141_length_17903_cov_0.288643.p8 type:complete len:171 gc:universal NODE_141_length_17903_cov_0.288643:15749-15237(-)
MLSALQKERLNPLLQPYSEHILDVEQRLGRAKLNVKRRCDLVLQHDIERHDYLVNQYKMSRILKIEKYPYYLLKNSISNMTPDEIRYCKLVIQCYEAFLLQMRNNFPQISSVIEKTDYHMAEPDSNIGILFNTGHFQNLNINDQKFAIDPDLIYATNFNQLQTLIQYDLQ